MVDTHRREGWSLSEFLAWEERQETRNEFVAGRVRAMVGGTRRHNAVCANVLSHLLSKLRGTKCVPYGPDMKTITPGGNVRYGDVTVDCGPMKGEDIAATAPTVIVEVLSKSTSWVDQSHKLDDYQSIPSMRHILHLSQDRAEGVLWSLEGAAWVRKTLAGVEAEADLAAIGIRFALSVAYEGVEFNSEPAPQNDNGEAQA
ncbi:MAG: Uma2 family endonuclease [Hyphomonadaceae bacterium]